MKLFEIWIELLSQMFGIEFYAGDCETSLSGVYPINTQHNGIEISRSRNSISVVGATYTLDRCLGNFSVLPEESKTHIAEELIRKNAREIVSFYIRESAIDMGLKLEDFSPARFQRFVKFLESHPSKIEDCVLDIHDQMAEVVEMCVKEVVV